jgi:cell wall-associated NlpC family hydrolase
VTRIALGLVGAVVLLPVLVISAATGGIQVSVPSKQARTGIPPNYLALYEQAGLASGLPWQLLAGIGKVACDHGRSPDPACTQHGVENQAGAGGPMQFLASTWAVYGLDADGDGNANRWDPVDAVFSAANDLRAAGAPSDIAAALYAYNHSQTYVGEVRAWADLYQQQGARGGALESTGPSAAGSSLAQAAVAFALAQLGTPYRWGGEGAGGFDCSGLVQAAYATAGIELPRVAQAQYDAGPLLPAGAQLERGDLVFFGGSPSDVTHVGIVVSPGLMVDAPHTGAVVRIESYAWPDYLGATRPATFGGAG